MKLPMPFYRDSAAAVLANFGSRTNGLANSEVTERKQHVEHFTVPPTKSHNNLTSALSHRLALLLGCVILAAYADEFSLAILLLFVVLLFGALSGIYDRHVWRGRIVSMMRLPRHTHVVRGNTLLRVSVSDIVAGDIVYLEAGDIAPADMRLLKTDNLSVTESIFTSSHKPIHKNSRTLHNFVARDKQTNMLFLGSNIINGNGYGVVTALGKHTELGRMLWADKKKPVRPISARMALFQRRLDLGCYVLLVLLALLALVNSWTIDFFAIASGSLVLATTLLDFYIAAPFIAARYTHLLGHKGTRVLQLASLESIGSTTTIVSDIRTALLSQTLTISQLSIGTQHYNITKKLTKNQQKSLQIIADTAHLLARLPANDSFRQLTDLLPATTTAEYTYESSSSVNPAESIHGSSWRHGTSIMRVASGELSELLNHTTHLWDHGHVRICTPHDRSRLTKIAAEQSSLGKTIIGFAYSHDDENQFVFAGYISANAQSPQTTKHSIAELKRAHIGIVLVSDESIEQTQVLLEHSGMVQQEYSLLTHSDITALDRESLAHITTKMPLVLQNVSQADIAYVVSTLQQNGPLTIVGDRIEIAEVLSKADAVIAGNRTLAADYASVLVSDITISNITNTIMRCRELLTKLAGLQQVTPLIALSLVMLFALSIGLYATLSVPLITSAYTVGVMLIIVLPIIISSAWDKAPARVSSTPPHLLAASKINFMHALLQTILLTFVAAAAFLGFLMLHNISPSGLSMTSAVYEKAFTVTVLTLAICVALQVFIGRSNSRHALKSSAGLSLYFWASLIASISIIYAIAYSVSLHELLGTSSPLSQDWILINGLSLSYGLIAVLLHYDKHHTRAAISALHDARKK